jgi:EAL domain-containing protein (putative c-di-GMP-specific phosphodiesterase class I)
MKTVAEGIETEEQLRTLREVGCERAQGYLLGRPAPLPKMDVATLGSAA